MQMHFYMFESFQLERLYVTNLLHRFSVNVCSEGTREENKELPVLSLFACIMATLNRNFFFLLFNLILFLNFTILY